VWVRRSENLYPPVRGGQSSLLPWDPCNGCNFDNCDPQSMGTRKALAVGPRLDLILTLPGVSHLPKRLISASGICPR
jgi:hypothetical protein